MLRTLFFLSFPITVLISCTSKSNHDSQYSLQLSEADSLEILSAILAVMKNEMYNEMYITTNLDTTWISSDPYGISYCGRNYIFTIQRNHRNQLMIGDDLSSDFSQITLKIVEFFSWNEESNDLNSRFPLFSRVTRQEIIDNLYQAKEELSETEKDNNAEKDMILFKKKQFEEWETRLQVLKTLDIEELPEIHRMTKVEISCQKETNPNLKKQVLDSVIVGFYQLRERCAQKYFNESYARIYRRQMELPNSADQDKLEAIEFLNRVRVIDYSTLKKYLHISPVDDTYDPSGTE